MILPITVYGDPVLRKETDEIDQNYPYKELIANMFETMYAANGVGLAAPQVDVPVRVFVVDASPFSENEDLDPKDKAVLEGFKKVFINPIIVEEEGDKWSFEEGCLSIPGLNADVSRHAQVTIEYYDENWVLKEETYTGLAARVIQHEYDHIEGVLFTDLVSPLKKRFLAKKLARIAAGDVHAEYKLKRKSRKR